MSRTLDGSHLGAWSETHAARLNDHSHLSRRCPNWQQTYERLQQVLAGRNEVVLTMTLVSSPGEAQVIRFRGSPSVLIEGVDQHADSSQLAAGTLACRVDNTQDGSPTTEDLQAAVTQQ